MDNKQSASGGCSALTVVQIVFIILKLVGVITWPWKYVLIPLWIELGLAVLVLAICGLVVLIMWLKEVL